MQLNINSLTKYCANWTDPAAETKSIGLPANAQLAAFFAVPLIKYTLTRNLLTVNPDYAAKTILS
jgi:hypothetical protein